MLRINEIVIKFLNEHGGMTIDAPCSKETTGEQETHIVLEGVSSLITQLQTVADELKKKSGATDKQPIIDKSLVQITADNAEIERRIQAFMDKKQRELDEVNTREFCPTTHWDTEDEVSSCARTDAVYSGGKSHVKVSRVINPYGPQSSREPPKVQVKKEVQENISSGLEERLKNMETHVNIRSGGRLNVYERIKQLEARLLHLESISPEYLESLTSMPEAKRFKSHHELSIKQEEPGDDMDIGDVDNQIQDLKRSLMLSQLPCG